MVSSDPSAGEPADRSPGPIPKGNAGFPSRPARDLPIIDGRDRGCDPAMGEVRCGASPIRSLGPDSGTVWGFVRLVPKAEAPQAGGGYGDRRLATVKRVDYSHPRYAVVYLPDSEAILSSSAIELKIVSTSRGARVEPEFSSTDPASGLIVRNESGDPQIVSAPAARWLERIEPGQSRRIVDPPHGELLLHVLGTEGSHSAVAQVWVASGRRVDVDSSGRFSVPGLLPGRHVLRAWHPRLPPSPPTRVDVELGGVYRADLEIGVDVGVDERGENP
jgi:hypothetical protein